MDQSSKVWIILGAVLGTLVLTGVTVLVLFCWKRSKRRVRGFSLRAVTPLDDAEFESWRRPSQYTKRPEKYGIRPSKPAVIRDRTSPTLFEKELSTYEFPRTPSPQDMSPPMKSPSSSIRKPERVRRKSSVASSIADRPPTPYSPTSPTSPSGEFSRGSVSSRRSQPLIHYPSMSEASAFRFEFESEYGTHQKRSGRWI
ncbi:Nn.00g016670.m01.CDS01 [Neocucurbitaria sp. VM-36]